MWDVCIIIRPSKCQPQSGQEHLWSQELNMNDALCTIMIMHSTLWEAIKIFLLRVFFFKAYFRVTRESNMRFSRRLCILNLAELSAKYFGILFMCASCSERGEWELAWKKGRKEVSHLHYIKEVWLGLTISYCTFQFLRSIWCINFLRV